MLMAAEPQGLIALQIDGLAMKDNEAKHEERATRRHSDYGLSITISISSDLPTAPSSSVATV